MNGVGNERWRAILAGRLHVMSIAEVIAVIKGFMAPAWKLLEYPSKKKLERLQKELDDLRDVKALRDTLEHKGNAYWKDDAPHCTGCFDVKGKLVRLSRRGLESSRGDCPVCKTTYRDVYEVKPPPPQRPRPKSRRDQFLDT